MMKSERFRLSNIFLMLALLITSGCVSSEMNVGAIRMLIDLGQNDKLKQEYAEQETINFQRLKEYIDSGKIKKGVSGESVITQFGTPVAVSPETETERWAYKRGDVNWIGEEKIYLFFDKEGNLIQWECIDSE